MKKFLSIFLAFIVMMAFFTGCKAKTSDNPTGNEDNSTIEENSNSNDNAENNSENNGDNESNNTGLIKYDSNSLLVSYTDYIYSQSMTEHKILKDTLDLEKGDAFVVLPLSFSTLNSDYCVMLSLHDDFMGSGKTLGGNPVTKKTDGDITTWDTEKIIENDFGNDKKGDINKIHITLNTKTNTLTSEDIKMRGDTMISKTVNKVIALTDGTILSEYYIATPDERSGETVTTADIFKYNKKTEEYECISGTFINPVIDFTAPSLLTADNNIDHNGYISFANILGTVKVSGGKGEIILP